MASPKIPDNIYPARGRKRDRLLQYLPLDILFPTIFTPQGDGNNFPTRKHRSTGVSYSRQYLPRKGTETEYRKCISDHRNFQDSRQYLPRKGTETDICFAINTRFLSYSRQYLPRKGTETKSRPSMRTRQDRALRLFPTIFTPQGDGNREGIVLLDLPKQRRIPDNIYPARGRKPGATLPLTRLLNFIPDNIYPARGRKRSE